MTQDQSYADLDAEQRRQLIEILVAYRKAAGVSQSELARRLGVAQPTVSQYEVGQNPHLCSLQRYARALGVQVVVEVQWMCLGCNDYFGPDDEDEPPLCIMCLKAGPEGPQ